LGFLPTLMIINKVDWSLRLLLVCALNSVSVLSSVLGITAGF
jgi:hypothetical protein